MCSSTDSSFWKEQAIVNRGCERSTRVREHLLGGGGLEIGGDRRHGVRAQTAHSPFAADRPRTARSSFQSMKWFMFSRLNSTGIVRSFTWASNSSAPTRVDESVEFLALQPLGLVEAYPALDRFRHALGRKPGLQALP